MRESRAILDSEKKNCTPQSQPMTFASGIYHLTTTILETEQERKKTEIDNQKKDGLLKKKKKNVWPRCCPKSFTSLILKWA